MHTLLPVHRSCQKVSDYEYFRTTGDLGILDGTRLRRLAQLRSLDLGRGLGWAEKHTSSALEHRVNLAHDLSARRPAGLYFQEID